MAGLRAARGMKAKRRSASSRDGFGAGAADGEAERVEAGFDRGALGELVAAVHQDRGAGGGEGQGGEQEPGLAAGAAGAVAGPIEVDGRAARWEAGADLGAGGFDQAGDLVGRFAAVAEQHQEGADLLRLGLAAQHHAERVAGLLAREGARAAGAAAEGADVGGEGVLGSRVGHGGSEDGKRGRGQAGLEVERLAGFGRRTGGGRRRRRLSWQGGGRRGCGRGRCAGGRRWCVRSAGRSGTGCRAPRRPPSTHARAGRRRRRARGSPVWGGRHRCRRSGDRRPRSGWRGWGRRAASARCGSGMGRRFRARWRRRSRAGRAAWCQAGRGAAGAGPGPARSRQ